MKKLALLLVTLAIATPAFAEEKKVRLNELSPQQRKAYVQKKETDWQKMSQEQKLAFVEKERTDKLHQLAEKIRKDDAKWKNMSADEKIQKHERGLKMLGARINKMDGKRKG